MSTDQHFAATKKVTLISGTINSLLAIFKIAIGFIGHSHALIADGLHSLSDLISDGLVFIAAKAGSRRPDKEHPYGHRRIETIAAIVIAIILLAAGGGIIFDAIRHLMQHEYLHKPDIWVLVVAGASIIANEYLYRYNLKVGKKIHSNLLISNAWHNRSDALTSFIVLISAIGAILGWRFLDAIGAIVIAVLIIRIAVKIIWDSSNELIDRAVDEKTLQDFTQTIKSCAGVISLHQLRTRLHGGHIFVDLHIQVEGHISVSEGHFIGQQVHIKLMHKFPKIADVTVHIDPEDDEISMPAKDLPSREALLPIFKNCWKNIPSFSAIEKINLHYLNGQLTIEIYLPKQYSSELNLQQQYQQAIQQQIHPTQVKLFYSYD